MKSKTSGGKINLVLSTLILLLMLASPSFAQILEPQANSTSPPNDPPINSTDTPISLPPFPRSTGFPSFHPTTSSRPSVRPTISASPTNTLSSRPSVRPTVSSSPTSAPSSNPTAAPTVWPTLSPTSRPSYIPSSSPTLTNTSKLNQIFVQDYIGTDLEEMDALYQGFYQNALASYTIEYGACEMQTDFPKTCRVTTICEVMEQEITFLTIGQRRNQDKDEPVSNKLEVTFKVTWSSNLTNVELYDDLFKIYMNSEKNGKSRIKDVMNSWDRGTVDSISNIETKNPVMPPTGSPVMAPFTSRPTSSPTVKKLSLPTPTPTTTPSIPSQKNKGYLAPVIVATVCAAILIISSLFIYLLKRKKSYSPDPVTNESHIDTGNVDTAVHVKYSRSVSSGSSAQERVQFDDSESCVSNKSLIRVGLSNGIESIDEQDSTNILADEFDQYVNPDLESVRINVEQKVTDSDGMMSQALTRALMMDDEEAITHFVQSKWGGKGGGMEIEASVLCDTNDWLKKKETASMEDKKKFLQDAVNNMVACVRHNIIQSEDASRTIHECASMLGMNLAENIPETTVIVTGMRKTVEKADVIDAFQEFGAIDAAAVAQNSRGFGLVRYKSPKSVLRALKKCRVEEIIVQDVGVTVRVFISNVVK